ncbi:MAG: ParB N-terminal domain-containing protein [Candidatus Thermoplasmatota archaeon]
MVEWSAEGPIAVRLENFGQRYARYRLHDPQQTIRMRHSLERHGQISPVVACRQGGVLELVDGFKRLGAAENIEGMTTLEARVMVAEERTAKAAIYCLNRVAGRTRELEEGWIVQALVREDGLTQVEVADLLERHKSWVCRRLALVERLSPAVREQVSLGLLSATVARELVRLPAGNQVRLLETIRREAFSRDDVKRLVEMLGGCTTSEAEDFVLAKPREALEQNKGSPIPTADPRLSAAGQRVFRQLGAVLGLLTRLDSVLTGDPRETLTMRDWEQLRPRLGQVAEVASHVGRLCADACRREKAG